MTEIINQPTVVSLLCGAGGMDYGFKLAGFKIILGIDIDKDCCDTYKSEIGAEVWNRDILKINPDELPDSDIIVSSIITPSFSLGNANKPSISKEYISAITNIIKNKHPKAIVFECIKSLKSYEKGSLFDELLITLEDLGYRVTYQNVNTMNYSIPQKRSRLIIIGIKKSFSDIRYEFPTPHSKILTLGDIFSDVNLASNTTTEEILNEKRVKVLNLREVSSTIVSNRKYYLDFSPLFKRVTSIEAALIQSFPKEYVFSGKENSRLRQIYLAFPPALAYYIAKEMMILFGVNENKYIEYNDLVKLTLSISPSNINDNKDISNNHVKHDNSILRLGNIQRGRNHAYLFEDYIFQELEFIFDSQLKLGQKQVEINDGRKRIDIVFNNKIGKGFFLELKTLYDIKCARIFIECKNYRGDLTNKDFDQLSSRFNRNYSEFGILVCREIYNKEKTLKICKDILNNGRGYVLVLDDTDILNLIELRKTENYEGIDNYMLGMLNKLLS